MSERKIDERTERYLAAIQQNIGLLGHNAGWNEMREMLNKRGIEYTKETWRLPGLLSPSMMSWDVEIFSYSVDGQPRWAVEWSYRTDIDDYIVESYVFNKQPTEHDIKTAVLIERIRLEFSLQRILPTFTCWECGKEAHWLDGEQIPLKERWDRLKERYCGC